MLSLWLYATALAVSLEEAWDAAQKNSLDLNLVHEQTLQAQAQRFQAFAAIQPQISMSGNYIFNDKATEADLASGFLEAMPEEFAPLFEDVESEPIILEQKSYFTYELQIAQPLLNGQAFPGLRIVGQNLKAARAEERSVRAQLKAGLAKVYYGLVIAREAYKLTDEAVVNANQHAEMVEKQLAAGLAPPNVRLQAQLAVARSERERANAAAAVERAEQAFALMTGLDPSSAVQLPEPMSLPVDSLEEALDAALSDRADLEAAAYRMNAAEANRGLSYAGWLPSLTGVFRFNVNPATDFNPDPTRWKIILNAQWDLWDGGMRIGANQIASSQFRQASDAEEKARLEAEQQVNLAWMEYERASIAVASVEREVLLAADNLRLAEVAYQAGSLTFLDLEDARLGWKAARMSQLGERMNRDLAVIDLLAAMGRY